MNGVRNKTIAKRNKVATTATFQKQLRRAPAFMLEEKVLMKYWYNRFELFSRFDEGIRLDRESWFSVTPERIAKYQAERLASDVVIDGFCGSGGNAIQFAKTCGRVIAIDIDPDKVAMAKHNARIYGVHDRIDFRVGDFLSMCSDGSLPRADFIFLSPPWGGPSYNRYEKYDIERSLQPVGGTDLMRKARKISHNIALYLPKNSDLKQIVKLNRSSSEPCEVYHNYLGNRKVAITVFYGDRLLNRNSKHVYFDSHFSDGLSSSDKLINLPIIDTSFVNVSLPPNLSDTPVLGFNLHTTNSNNAPINLPIIDTSFVNVSMPPNLSYSPVLGFNFATTNSNNAPKYLNNWQIYSNSSLNVSENSLNTSSNAMGTFCNACAQCNLM